MIQRSTRRAAPRLTLALALSGCLSAVLAGCTSHAPTTADPSASAPKVVASTSAEPAASAASAPVASASASASATSAEPAPPEVDPLDTPTIVDADGNALPQTDESDKPSFQSPAWQKRARLLFEAIQKDDPEIATRVFFPKEAYMQVKDIPKPEADWKSRLMKAFKRDIHKYHKGMKKPELAEYVGFKADEKRAKWMPPRGEGNKVGYYRILHTKLQYKNADGKNRELDITSLISWRGEWFVVHVDGFK